MFKRILLVILVATSLCGIANSEEYLLEDLRTYIAAGNDKYKKDNPFKREQVVVDDRVLNTPQSEVEDFLVFKSKFRPEDQPFIKGFTTYAVYEEFRQEEVLELSFMLNSLIGPSLVDQSANSGSPAPLARMIDGEFVPFHQVPGSDTLWWIDIRDYNWTPAAWEIVSQKDGYFAEPIVDHRTSGALRLSGGNDLLRSDWFIKQAANSTDQTDIGDNITISDTLLYALSKAPKTTDEFRKAWGFDLKKEQKFGNEYGTITNSGIVARHNRYLFSYNGSFGPLFETYDVLAQQGTRDYIEGVFLNNEPGAPPDKSDAGELIYPNIVGMKVYALRNGQDQLVSFADPTAARHMQDVLGDARVRVSFSCMDCHSAGAIPSSDVLVNFLRAKGALRVYDKPDMARLKRSILNGKFNKQVKLDQQLYADALRDVNGLTPEENGRYFLRTVLRYDAPITLEQAAYECGVTVEMFKEKIRTTNARFGGRLKMLVQDGYPIPRDAWETKGIEGVPGVFQQAMIILNGLTAIQEDLNTEYLNVTPETQKLLVEVLEVKTQGAEVYDGKKKVAVLKQGTKLLPLESKKFSGVDWYRVEVRTTAQSKVVGWIMAEHVVVVRIGKAEADSYFK